MIDTEVEYETSVEVNAPLEQAWALLSDVKRSGMHFPGVQSLEPTPGLDGGWTWTMKEKGVGPISLKVQYDAVYSTDPDAHVVRWEPPARGGGDMESFGTWTLSETASGGTRLDFSARTVAHVPASRLVAKMVEMVAREELRKLKAEYVQAIKRSLDASVA